MNGLANLQTTDSVFRLKKTVEQLCPKRKKKWEVGRLLLESCNQFCMVINKIENFGYSHTKLIVLPSCKFVLGVNSVFT